MTSIEFCGFAANKKNRQQMFGERETKRRHASSAIRVPGVWRDIFHFDTIFSRLG